MAVCVEPSTTYQQRMWYAFHSSMQYESVQSILQCARQGFVAAHSCTLPFCINVIKVESGGGGALLLRLWAGGGGSNSPEPM